ncbi:hypothetical protein D9M71_275600 [compost metagenome]
MGKIIAQGRSVALPQSSALMKLPMRPAPRPIGTSGAMKSISWKKLLLLRLPNQRVASITPIRPPWKDMPPFQTSKISSGLAMYADRS